MLDFHGLTLMKDWIDFDEYTIAFRDVYGETSPKGIARLLASVQNKNALMDFAGWKMALHGVPYKVWRPYLSVSDVQRFVKTGVEIEESMPEKTEIVIDAKPELIGWLREIEKNAVTEDLRNYAKDLRYYITCGAGSDITFEISGSIPSIRPIIDTMQIHASAAREVRRCIANRDTYSMQVALSSGKGGKLLEEGRKKAYDNGIKKQLIGIKKLCKDIGLDFDSLGFNKVNIDDMEAISKGMTIIKENALKKGRSKMSLLADSIMRGHLDESQWIGFDSIMEEVGDVFGNDELSTLRAIVTRNYKDTLCNFLGAHFMKYKTAFMLWESHHQPNNLVRLIDGIEEEMYGRKIDIPFHVLIPKCLRLIQETNQEKKGACEALLTLKVATRNKMGLAVEKGEKIDPIYKSLRFNRNMLTLIKAAKIDRDTYSQPTELLLDMEQEGVWRQFSYLCEFLEEKSEGKISVLNFLSAMGYKEKDMKALVSEKLGSTLVQKDTMEVEAPKKNKPEQTLMFAVVKRGSGLEDEEDEFEDSDPEIAIP